MIRRQIEIDEESDRILSELSHEHEGGLSGALSDLLRAHQTIEAFVEQCEEAEQESLAAQRRRAERDFREGRFTTWDQVKRDNNL